MDYGESSGHVTNDLVHMTVKGRHDTNILWAHYLEKAGDAMLCKTIANY